jgi:hypothetical protein
VVLNLEEFSSLFQVNSQSGRLADFGDDDRPWAPHGYFFGTALACENPLRIKVFKPKTLTAPVF